MTAQEIRRQAWDYFQMQAGHRLITFNFYISISSVLSTGLAASFKLNEDFSNIGLAFGLLLILFSFIFWKLDQRNADLIQGAESALVFFESESTYNDLDIIPHVAKRFTRSEFDTKQKKRNNSWRFWINYFSYSSCFRFVFIVFGFVGLIGSIISIMRFF
jgi:hypothetical protein